MMNMMNTNPQRKIELTIAGSSYTFVTDESESYMRDLGANFDQEMRKLMENPRISTTMAAVMVALKCMDDLKKSEASADNLRAQMKNYMDDSARTRNDTASMRREMEMKDDKIRRLEDENRRLRERLG